jgi:hypothetical protein
MHWCFIALVKVAQCGTSSLLQAPGVQYIAAAARQQADVGTEKSLKIN